MPRLVASRTEGVEIDAARGTGEYPGEPIDIGTLWEGAAVTPEDASGSTWVTYDDAALHVFVQVIDDTKGHTIASASTLEAELRNATEMDKTAKARRVGELVAERAKAAGIESVVFDRGGNKYHGRVAAVADGAREGGLAL